MSDGKKITVQALIQSAAEAAAREVVKLQQQPSSINYYMATERILRAYPALKQLAEHPEDYGFFKEERSHDITVAPPPGTPFRDTVEIQELFTEARRQSFVKTLARFFELDASIKLFENRREFVVIRMYYFGEDASGQERDPNAPPWTWETIAEALDDVGISRSVSVLRGWRTTLVRELSVVLFGTEGAVSLSTKHSNVKKADENTTDED